MSSHVETVRRHIATLESMLTSRQPYASRGLEIDVSLPAQMGKLLCLLLDEGNTSFKHADEWDFRNQKPLKRLVDWQKKFPDEHRAWKERMIREGIEFDPRGRPMVRVELPNPDELRLECLRTDVAIFVAYICYEIAPEPNTLPFYWESQPALRLLDIFCTLNGKPTTYVDRVFDFSGETGEAKREHDLVESVRVQIAACHHLLALLERQPEDPQGKTTGTKGEHDVNREVKLGIGFLGATELADALGVPTSRQGAFFKKLERDRSAKLLQDGCVVESSNRRKNAPQFLYRADAQEILRLAARFK
jgi:hypothetical protein